MIETLTCIQCSVQFERETWSYKGALGPFCGRPCFYQYRREHSTASARSIRTLRPGEPVPAGEPMRFRSSTGYVELRWKVARCQYVRCYEHRLVAGVPAGQDVHHLNHDKTDNAPSNLAPLSKRRHRRAHTRWDVTEALALRAAGATLKGLAARYGVHHVTILRVLRTATDDVEDQIAASTRVE